MKLNLPLLIAVSFLIIAHDALSDNSKSGGDEALRKSNFSESSNFNPDKSSYPMGFNELNNPVSQAAISTGYYFVDSDDDAPDYWRPLPAIVDTNYDKGNWHRIMPGARIKARSYWLNNWEGLAFFRNPAVPGAGDFFTDPADSTDDAIAGPIPIDFDFYFNGLKFDSFYVSTNGLIALTNNRYLYDNGHARKIPNGSNDCYNKYSMDWFYPGRTQSGDGISDTLYDDFGYFYSVCGGNPDNPTGGIRSRGGALNQEVFKVNKSAIIAPFFGDMHLSQFNPKKDSSEDWGRVYYKRSAARDKLIIYYVNASPVRTLKTAYGNLTGEFNLRPGDNNYLSVSAQIVLDKKDSSIIICYEKFDGVASVSGKVVPANYIFRFNTTVGVHGFARHTNNDHLYPNERQWSGEYQQYTHYYSNYEEPQQIFAHNNLAIKFKQWKNTLRVSDIYYRVRKQVLNSSEEPTETIAHNDINNFEIVAGDDILGTVQPVGVFQNISNNIQGIDGVNYQEQQIGFRTRCRMVNEASYRIVYNRMIIIDSTALASPDSYFTEKYGWAYPNASFVKAGKLNGNYSYTELPFPGADNLNGLPPYGFVRVFFPLFIPNEYVNNQIGRLKVSVIAEPINPSNNKNYKDEWAFDDTLSSRLFVLKRIYDFQEDFSSFHVIKGNKIIPSTLRWVNIDAEIQSGDDVSLYPVSPRGDFQATNNYDYSFKEPDFTKFTVSSPCARMDRKTLDRQEPLKSLGGDQLRSFPIDLRGKFGAILSISVQRTAKRDDWPRGWSDQELIGPEPRTVINSNPFSVWSLDRAASSQPDELVVEYAQPSPDGITGITNIPEYKWRIHPRRQGAKPVTNMPVLSIFGAGGYMVGWLESDRDSALSPPAIPKINGLRPDIYDDGIDFEYKKYFLPVPDTFIKAANEGAKYFRFRINMQARDNKKCLTCIPDDDDAYFVDNIKMLFPCECTDIEMSLVKILWPYTIAPASQAIKVPIRVKIANNTDIPAPPFRVKVKIFRKGESKPIYCRVENLPTMSGKASVEYAMPNWDARRAGPGEYKLLAYLLFGDPSYPDQDLEPLNDTAYTFINMNFGDVFAYDPPKNPRNDVPDNAFTGLPGHGINLYGVASGGVGNINGPSGSYDIYNEVGYPEYFGGSGFGQIAMKFTLYQPDTVYGYKAFFGSLNSAFDDIAFAIYRDANQPSTLVNGSLIYKFRGFDDIRHEAFWDEYVTYLLRKPIVLQPGTYWMAVSQLGETGFQLGASKSRMGMRTTNIYLPPPNYLKTNYVGAKGNHLMIDKNLRRKNAADNLINDNKFCFENTRGSGVWSQFMPTQGNPAYGHLHHFGLTPVDNYTLTLSRGTWIPMIRPYLGLKSSGYDQHYEECYDYYDPVKLTTFDGIAKGNGIELYWVTVSERFNYGFYLDKKTDNDDSWQPLSFVGGRGTSNEINNYRYLDEKVSGGTTYSYRIRQADLDGTTVCESEAPSFSIYFTGAKDLELEQSRPNPATNYTLITYYIPGSANVKLEVVDLYGRLVKTILHENAEAGKYTKEWNLTDNLNRFVASGVYICRLTAGSECRTMNITVVK